MDVVDPVVERSRQRLWHLAYRSVSSRVEADDVVQETWLRWNRSDRSAIANPEGWLTAVTAHLAIDRLRVRQRERVRYVGPWLPEPVESDRLATFDVADPVLVDEQVVSGAG